MPADFELRLATLDDLPALRELIPQAARALSSGHYSVRQIESAVRHVFGPDTQLIKDGTFFVAEVAGQPVGCGGWGRRRTLCGGDQMKCREDLELDPAAEPARIRAFFVHPEAARRGIGRSLLTACVVAARKHGFKSLELLATLPGEPLYRAGGFVAIERYELNLPDGIPLPVVRMTRCLGEPV